MKTGIKSHTTKVEISGCRVMFDSRTTEEVQASRSMENHKNPQAVENKRLGSEQT